ncbi:MAG: Beta-glucosidase [Polyangiaceae bacterium]|jgi:beta-glucosidase|nr:Beta-glucosidase [Polyangiaceae bacterium]
MRKNSISALHLGSGLLVATLLYSACSTRPSGVNVTPGGTAGTSAATAGSGAIPGGMGGSTGVPGTGGSANGTAGGLGTAGTTPIMENDATCMVSPKQTANVLKPVDPRTSNLVQQLTRDEKLAMLSGGQRLASDWWTIDFNATGAEKIGLKDMPMRDGPRGVHQLNNSKSTTFAVAEARAAAFDVNLEYRVGEVIAAEMKAFKYDVMLAPTMNVLRHPGWGRAQETYGEDPVLVGKMASAFVRGMQEKKMMACPKHFAVNNTENNRGDGADEPNVNMVVDPQTLRENYLRHFQMVIEEADPACIMAAYNRVNGLRCTQNPELITKIVRDEWQWTGMMVSDWWATVANQGNTSILAGLDLEMPDNNAFKAIDTTVPGTRIDEAATRIVNARLKFAHDTDAYKNAPENVAIINEQTHKDLAKETALKGAVLLKNDNLLPLGAMATAAGMGKADAKSIVVLGPDAMKPNTDVNTAGVASGLGDRGSSATNPPYAVSFFDGLKAAGDAKGVAVTTNASASAANTADIAIIPVTMAWEDEGEGYDVGQDRADLTLSGQHPKHWGATKPAAFIAQAVAANPNTIVVLAVGSAIVMEDWYAGPKAIVQTFYPGQEGGNALASLVFGDTNFSGKLPFTVAMNPADYPPFQNTTGEDAMVDYFHGYRKFEKEAKMPRFWFGFGMSYTNYTYGDVKVLCTTGIAPDGALNVEIPVTNAGKMAGDEIVQLYIGYPMTAQRRPAKELKAFARVTLAPGQTQNVQFRVPARDMAYWGATGWTVEKGPHSVLIGPSADPTKLKSAPFTIN